MSNWAGSAVLASKKDGKLRVLSNYRMHGAMNVQTMYPLPLTDEYLTRYEMHGSF